MKNDEIIIYEEERNRTAAPLLLCILCFILVVAQIGIVFYCKEYLGMWNNPTNPVPPIEKITPEIDYSDDKIPNLLG